MEKKINNGDKMLKVVSKYGIQKEHGHWLDKNFIQLKFYVCGNV